MHRIPFAFATIGLALTAPLSAQIRNSTLISQLQLGNDTETRDLFVDGDTVYIARNHLGVSIVDVQNPAAPQLITNLMPDPGGVVCVNDVVVHDDYLYVIDGSGVIDSNLGNYVGVYIYDVTTPATPTLTGYLLWGDMNVPWSWRAGKNVNATIGVIGNVPYLFVASHITYAVEVFDVSNPAQPVWKAVIDRAFNSPFSTIRDMTIVGDRMYSCWQSGGYMIHDVSNVGSTVGIGDAYGPQPVTIIANNPYPNAFASHVALTDDGSSLLVTETKQGGSMRIFDVFTGVETGSFRGTAGTIPHKPTTLGQRAYLAHFEDGLRVAEITDRANPSAAAWFDTSPSAASQNTMQGAWGVQVEGSHVFVSDTVGGLFVFTVSDDVTITRARYRRRSSTVLIHATSTAAPAATLTVPGLGTLTYQANRNRYRGVFPVSSQPASVSVESTVGGSASANL